MAIIGIDIDNTLAKNSPWIDSETIEEPEPKIVGIVEELKRRGHQLAIWSCRADHVIKQYLEKHDLIHLFSFINDSPYPTDSRKISFDFLIDDVCLTSTISIEDILKIVDNLKPINIKRDRYFSDQNLKLFYQGGGKLFVDFCEKKWRELWTDHIPNSIAFLTICSHAKPYSKSYLHGTIRKCLYEWGYSDITDYVHISGVGIIPQTKEMTYPFNAYDGDSSTYSDEVRTYHIAAIERRVKEWLEQWSHQYKKIVIYLRKDGNTAGAVTRVLRQNSYENVYLVLGEQTEKLPFAGMPDIDDCLTSEQNLNQLKEAFK